ncbi:MAG: YncE family protein [Muribaculaceae bacterium]|nr:YncE family protein [Muribaculaceae bacterium]
MKKLFFFAATAALMSLSLTSCSDDDDKIGGLTPPSVEGLFVVCNGNYMAGNGSLSYYNTDDNTVDNEVFFRANGMKLGDTAQSMSIDGKTGWICVNGSNTIYAIDVDTYMVKGQVKGISSPRNTLRISNDKLYVTSLYDNRITIVNPADYTISGYIDIPDMEASTGSTEQLVKVGDYVYVNCWSYQKEVLKIDSRTDKVVDSLEVGIQPESIAYDGNSSLWVLCDGGGWDGNPIGFEAPTLVCVDLKAFEVERTIQLAEYSSASKLTYYAGNLYWLENGVRKMSVNAVSAPASPLIPTTSYALYSLTVNPSNGEIYVGDAVDYMQNGTITRYDPAGKELDSFTTGVIPAGFCWKTDK